MKGSRGFSLVELVVVIVILGVLATVVAPRFIGLQSKSRLAALREMRVAMESSGAMIYGRAAIGGMEKSSQAVDVSGIETMYGYPTATSAGIISAVQGLDDEQEWQYGSAIGGGLAVTFAKDIPVDGSMCSIVYKNAVDADSSPEIVLVDKDC